MFTNSLLFRSLIIVTALGMFVGGCSQSTETASELRRADDDERSREDTSSNTSATVESLTVETIDVVDEDLPSVELDSLAASDPAKSEPAESEPAELGPAELGLNGAFAPAAPTGAPLNAPLNAPLVTRSPSGTGFDAVRGVRGPAHAPPGGFSLPGNFDAAATASISAPPTLPPSVSTSGPVNASLGGSEAASASLPQAETLPAGATREAGQGFATVRVFYATDRAQGPLSLSAYEFTGYQRTIKSLCICAAVLFVISAFSWIFKRSRIGTLTTLLGTASAAGAAAIVIFGHASIEKHGVTYSGDRGVLTRGICEVTVPDDHQKGQVERPSLLRFEFHEDQQEHIVLTSAVELPKSEFQARLSETVAKSTDRDLLVFIHGYNVDFQSAVQRTAQISVDLPFEGVPVCYSWPSQAKLLGYSIDENNSQWTVAHLKEFLLELAQQSGAQSINVVAHSMGNRAMTAALQQIQLEQTPAAPPMFDRLVLAAPDVDADLFRKDLAPALLQVSKQVTLYASSDDQALIASKKVHGYPRAGESGRNLVVMPGIETIDVSGIDLSLLGHSYYGDNESMLHDLYQVVRSRLRAPNRRALIPRQTGSLIYWQLAQQPGSAPQR